MYVTEFRIIMPLTVDEYKIGQLFAIAEASVAETGGGEGVEVLNNEQFEDIPLFGGRYTSGQYTRKVYHFASKVAWWIRKLAPKKSLVAVEEAWNAFPYCKTVATSQNDDYVVTIESLHLPDRGTTENALELPPEILAKRKVVYIDIAGKLLCEKDYKAAYDPNKFKSNKTGRGPLAIGWAKTHEPVMCCYKVVKIEVKGWRLFRGRIQSYLSREYPRVFQRFHRRLFCSIDRWHGLSIEDVRNLEWQTREDLQKQMLTRSKKGAPPPEE